MQIYRNILHSLRDAVKRFPQRPLLQSTNGSSLTFIEFLHSASKVAAALRAAGHRRGGLVTIHSEDPLVFFPCILGTWLNAGIAVPINLRYAQSTIQNIVARIHPQAMLADMPLAYIPENAVVLEHKDLPVTAPSSYAADNEPLPDETGIIYFTSGTTGISKGAQLTWDAINHNAFSVSERLQLGANDKIYINTPPYYTSGLSHFLTLLARMGSMVCGAGFQFGADLFAEMSAFQCTGFGGAPAHMIRAIQPLQAPFSPDPLRFWISSGDHLPADVLQKARTFLPSVKFYVMYGLSEVAGRLCIQMPECESAYPGSVGTPLPEMEVTARDSAGNILPAGETGELYVRGRCLMTGYYGAPELTRESMTKHGFRTGDLGKVNQDGFVWVEGRQDDIFKCGGEKVSLQLVQQALLNLAGIQDAATLAEEDNILGKTVCAFLVTEGDSRPTPMEIVKKLRGNLPDNHIPKRIIFLPAIPRTGSGKAIKAELKNLLERSRL